MSNAAVAVGAKANDVRENAAKPPNRRLPLRSTLTGDAEAIAPRIYDNVPLEMAGGITMARLHLWQGSGWPLRSFIAHA